MRVEADAGQRCYTIHGVAALVSARDPVVLEAMDLRFRDFRCEEGGRDAIRFEFVGADEGSDSPTGDGRPVYDTPYGSVCYFPEADALYAELAGVRLRCDPGRGTASLACASFAGRALYLATHPLATIAVMELLERRGLFSLHAACLATSAGDGVLLAGPTGAGKSTLALALARAGMRFLSDDVLFLEHESGGGVGVRGFADAIGLGDGTARYFAELQSSFADPPADGFPKHLLRIEDLLGVAPLPACTPRALVFPEVADEPSAIAPLDPREALLRLVPDVLLTEPGSTQAHLAAVAALIEHVDCYELRSGTDLERAAELVGGLVF